MPIHLIVGERYRIRYIAPHQKKPRVMVVQYIGRMPKSRIEVLQFDQRPIAGTLNLPEDWILTCQRVSKTTPIIPSQKEN